MTTGSFTKPIDWAGVTKLAERVRDFFQELQANICSELEQLDGSGVFGRDHWVRPEGGGGLTRVLQNGAVFEKAGVNTSAVNGKMPESLAQITKVNSKDFFATGISLVLHPINPMVPAVHANYRYFEIADGDSWFGGGSDLTPYYPYEQDIVHFHTTLKRSCDMHDPSYYPRFKKWCDEYFFIKHRGEARGTGGIFFDYLRGDPGKLFAFVQTAGSAFLDSYLPIVVKRMNEPYGQREKDWQLVRRGRYVEFNLVYDRGTTFGLETGGRTESILMSLPPQVYWNYDVQPQPSSREALLVDILKKPRDWVQSGEH